MKNKNTSFRVSQGGVSFRTDKGKWTARFTLDGKRVTVGSFNTERKAKQALKTIRSTYLNTASI